MNEDKKNKEILRLKNVTHIYDQHYQKIKVLNNINFEILHTRK